jgi:hypothetical protein
MTTQRVSNWRCEPESRKRGDATVRIICGWCLLIFAARWWRFVWYWNGVKRNWLRAVNGYYVQNASVWSGRGCSWRSAIPGRFFNEDTRLPLTRRAEY